MASLCQDSRGNYHSRRRIPNDCQADYKNLYGQRHGAKFYAPASVGRVEAQRLFREREAEVTRRIETIRRTQRGEGIDLTYKQAAGLAGEWYKWFIKRYENEPGERGGYWTLRWTSCLKPCGIIMVLAQALWWPIRTAGLL